MSSKREKLIEAVKQLAQEHRGELEMQKQKARQQLKRPDFVWHYLLQSFATMGSSFGWDGLIDNQSNYRRVTFDALAKLSPEERIQVLESTLRSAKVRWPAQKARQLNSNFERVMRMGGPTAAKEQLLSLDGPEPKMAFLSQFEGIGPKYSRSILMDVYHPEFRNSIALDQRIAKVSRALGLASRSYTELEQFYQQVAQEAGLEGWELDRILYNFNKEVLAALNSDA
jgi:thermostable 8-oxoguanine DNA glycosylase